MNSLGKGEGRHKRIQAVSPSILLEKGEERHKKNSGDYSLLNSFWQREKIMKRYNTLLFFAEFSLAEEKGLENRKLRKLFGKGK